LLKSRYGKVSSLRQEEIAALPPRVDKQKTDERAKTGIQHVPAEELATREQRHTTALNRVVGNVVATREEIKRLTVKSLPAISDAQYPRLMTREVSPMAIKQGMKALQPLSEKAVAKLTESLPIAQASPRQVARYNPPSRAVMQSEEFALVRTASSFLTGKTGSARLQPVESMSPKFTTPVETNWEALSLRQTINQRDHFSRAEDIVLAAIRSKADIDGKNARVAYDVLASMTGFSRRHVIRAVKSLIYERGLVRVDKRRLKPGRNAINVYHVVSRDVTATERGNAIKRGTTGQTETPRVTEHVTHIAKLRTIIPLRHASMSRPIVTEKQGSSYLTVDSKPRYLPQGVTPHEKAA